MLISQVLRSGRERFANGIAVHHGEHSLTYARLFDDAETVAARLAGLGVGPGEIVAVDVDRPLSHWVVLLALLRIGAVSLSLTDRGEREAEAVPGLAAVVCGPGSARPFPPAVRRIEVGADWLRSAGPAGGPLPEVARAAATAGRICFTSGTSGRPKPILLDAGLLGTRLAGTARRTRIHTRSVLWCGLGPDTAYGFTATLGTWLEGGTVVFHSRAETAYDELTRRHVNLVVASPAALRGLLRSTPSRPGARIDGPVIAIGGRLPAAMRDTLLQKVCSEVLVAYGSSETGGVTLGVATDLDRHPGRVGVVFDDVEVEAVDADGRILPPGTAGNLRIRTTSTAPRYLGDPVATAQHLVDGWFHPGDIGVVDADKVLTVTGRAVEIVNAGGVKLSVDDIAAAARAHPGIEDACALTLPGTQPELTVVVVGTPGSGIELAAHLRARLPLLPGFALFHVPALPRGSAGKIDRDALVSAFAATREAGTGGGSALLGTF